MAQAQSRQDQRSGEQSDSSERAGAERETAPPARSVVRSAIPRDQDDATICSNAPGAALEPVVRRWQESIGASLAAEEQVEDEERWSPSQSLPFLTLASLGLWSLLIVGFVRIL